MMSAAFLFVVSSGFYMGKVFATLEIMRELFHCSDICFDIIICRNISYVFNFLHFSYNCFLFCCEKLHVARNRK